MPEDTDREVVPASELREDGERETVTAGVSLEATVWDRLDDLTSAADHHSRSRTVGRLVGIGLAVEDAADQLDVDLPDDPETQARIVRQAMLDHFRDSW
jgi:hypothetical protein